MILLIQLISIVFFQQKVYGNGTTTIKPSYLPDPCKKVDTNFDECMVTYSNDLITQIRKGIPELGFYDDNIEPILIDRLQIRLGEKEHDYKSVFYNIKAYGVSNITVTNFLSNIDTYEYQMTFNIPRISVQSKYKSSGTLLLFPTNGEGDFVGYFDDVKVKVYFKCNKNDTNLMLDEINFDFYIAKIKMAIHPQQQSQLLKDAMNIFINENSRELLKQMKPSIKRKIIEILQNFIRTRIFNQIRYNQIIDENKS